ncbi:hypothetical protein AXF42_Ash009087 [Apostasia shenzhenica]|uniref:Uncharacterized protein n=1 Tax=Apostasia shenzhenica TaxID=1088818 RepID=A0A2I0ADF6_9ASPA|nr:hypothetical protein AXF42_Ash009087 [Apostasia shenzhenica]
MAVFSLTPSLHSLKLLHRCKPNRDKPCRRFFFPQRSHLSPAPEERGDRDGDRDGRERKKWIFPAGLISGVAEKLGKGLKEHLSPKRKGDWKDAVLMSFSFAVYVYISQQIVGAYCAWISTIRQF